MNKSRNTLIVMALSIIGWANSCYTLWHHIKINFQGIITPSFCDISSQVNCDQAALSKFAVFAGIPTAAWALLFYSTLLILCIWQYFSQQDSKEESIKVSASWIFALSIISLLPTVYLAGVSIVVLKNLCLLCLVTYITNILLPIFAFKDFSSTKASFSQLKFKAPTWVWSCIGVLIAFSLFLPSVFKSSINAPKLDDRAINQFINHLEGQKQHQINTENSPFIGNPNAEIVITEFSDFQCPYCARSAQTLPPLLKDYLDQVKLVFKNFPLNASCNPHVKSAGHPLACIAAKTAMCIYELKGNDSYLELKNTYFKQQSSLSKSFIKEHALKQGVDESTLEECINSVATNEKILADVNEAQRIGVEGTPAVFINGKLFKGASLPKVFKVAIEKIISN